jgi:hypothetical protein
MFVEIIEEYLAGRIPHELEGALFLIFHMLGSWRAKSAYRSLARLLRQPADDIERIFGQATTETSHRVMAAVFDGDPQPLYDIVLDPQADEYVRSRMCETLAMLVLNGELPRAEVARFLQACFADITPKHDCFVWNGWQSAIAALGLVELKGLVEQAFRRGYIDPSWLSFDDFEADLRHAIENPASPWRIDDEYRLFGDTIEELSGWAFTDEAEDTSIDGEGRWSPDLPTVNAFKHVGRNDPCPCGSGKKFKKCCLNKAVA